MRSVTVMLLILLWSGRARFFLHASHLDENVLNTTYADLNSAVDRRHNRSMWLVGRLRSNFVDRGDREYNMVPSNFYNWLSFFAGQCRELTDLLASCKGRWKEEWGRKRVKQGWSNSGRNREGVEKEKEVDTYSPHLRFLPAFQPWLRLCCCDHTAYGK